jgi:hypothetical protein
MKRSLGRYTATSLMCIGLLTTSVATFAQSQYPQEQSSSPQAQSQDEYRTTSPNPSNTNSPTNTTTNKSSKHSQMQDCIARERAGDSTMSKSDAKKACRNQQKAEKSQDSQGARPQ